MAKRDIRRLFTSTEPDDRLLFDLGRKRMSFTERWGHLRPWRRHSMVLLVAGLVFVAIGVSYITTDPLSSRLVALKIVLSPHTPMRFWGVVFVLAGLLSIVSSRWPPVSKTWGYMVLTGLSGAWSAAYATGIVFGHAPVSNISGVLTWGLVGFLWWAISGLVDPEPAASLIIETKSEG